jgi:hypothetical protein
MRNLAFVAIFLAAACGHDMSSGDDTTGPDGSVVQPGSGDPLGGLPTGTDQWNALCAKHYGDIISAKFCASSAPPTLTSLADLEALLGLTVAPDPNNNPYSANPNVRVTLIGESTGLGMRSVTPLTPRAFLMTPPSTTGAANPTYQVLSFSRGEPLVELVANDPAAGTLRFFLVRFHPACEPNCTFGDLQTPTIESGWTGYTLYDDATIKDTTLDCLACHQPGGPSSHKMLRMQELQNPWGHWFYPERPATLQIVQDFQGAHANEAYAGIPYMNVYNTRPFQMMFMVQNNGFANQPNQFNTLQINSELAASGTSATWDAVYANAVGGTAIPVPYYTNPFDATKLQAATTAYNQVIAGSLPPAQMPDISDVFLDSALPDMSVQPKPGLDGHGVLVHMCRMCHNSSLDQTISRANFNIDTLASLPRAEKDKAIARLQLPDTDAQHMPPKRFHELPPADLAAAISVLQQ